MVSTIKMKSEEESWKEHVVKIPNKTVNEIVEFLKRHLLKGWYSHLIKGDQMIVVYKNKKFKVKRNINLSIFLYSALA